MAVAANSLRLSLRACSHIPLVRIAPRAARQALIARRVLSTTPSRRSDETKETSEDSQDSFNGAARDSLSELISYISNQRELSEDELKEFESIAKEPFKDYPDEIRESLLESGRAMHKETEVLRRSLRPKRGAFWNEDEPDSDLITDEIGEDDFEEDDMMSMAHPKLEEHREYREYARIAVWEMPLLSRTLDWYLFGGATG